MFVGVRLEDEKENNVRVYSWKGGEILYRLIII